MCEIVGSCCRAGGSAQCSLMTWRSGWEGWEGSPRGKGHANTQPMTFLYSRSQHCKATLPRLKKIKIETVLSKLSLLSMLLIYHHMLCVCVWACARVPSIVSDSLRAHGLQPARLLCPWDSLGQNTGVGCHFLLQGIFLTQRLNPGLLCLLNWQESSLTLGSPRTCRLCYLLLLNYKYFCFQRWPMSILRYLNLLAFNLPPYNGLTKESLKSAERPSSVFQGAQTRCTDGLPCECFCQWDSETGLYNIVPIWSKENCDQPGPPLCFLPRRRWCRHGIDRGRCCKDWRLGICFWKLWPQSELLSQGFLLSEVTDEWVSERDEGRCPAGPLGKDCSEHSLEKYPSQKECDDWPISAIPKSEWASRCSAACSWEPGEWACLNMPSRFLRNTEMCQSLCPVWLSATPRPVAHQAALSLGFSRHAYWRGSPVPSPGDLPDPRGRSAGRFFTIQATREARIKL